MDQAKEEAGRSGLGVALGSLDYFGHRKDTCRKKHWQGTRLACFVHIALSLCWSGRRRDCGKEQGGGRAIGPWSGFGFP